MWFFVYQYAKLRMLGFFNDFIDKFMDLTGGGGGGGGGLSDKCTYMYAHLYILL